MGTGILHLIGRLCIAADVIRFKLSKVVLGFDNANRLLRIVDRRAAIPILLGNGAVIGKSCDIETPLIFDNCKSYANLRIGDNCHIGKEVFFDLRNSIIIHDSVTVSMRTTFITHLDVGKSPLKISAYHSTSAPIVLRNGCYIGANTTILMGVEIGECAIVGAGAVVTKDVPPRTVVAGNPARTIKKI